MRAILRTSKCLVAILLAAAIGIGLSSCGSATNNDQGVAITLLGFFSDFGDSDDCVDLPDGELGVQTPLSFGAEVSETPGLSGGLTTIAGVQNNLNGQFYRAQRALISYYIEGASAQPPSTSAALNMLVRPSVSADAGADGASTSFDSSLPDSFNPDSGCSIGYAEFFVLPPAIIEWLNFNQTALPEPPFFMTASVSVSGLTSAGDRIETNEANYDFIFTPATVIPPCNATDDDCPGQGADANDSGSAGLTSPGGLVLE